jgi:hypothetical protein
MLGVGTLSRTSRSQLDTIVEVTLQDFMHTVPHTALLFILDRSELEIPHFSRIQPSTGSANAGAELISDVQTREPK